MKKLVMLMLLMMITSSAFAMGVKPKDDFWSDLGKITKECYAMVGPTTGTGYQGSSWTDAYNKCYYPKRKEAGCARNIVAECTADISQYLA